MAIVKRRRVLVNPARRRSLKRKAKPNRHRPASRPRRQARRSQRVKARHTRRASTNPGNIISFGLAGLNPGSRPKRKRSNTMAKVRKARRAHAKRRSVRRRANRRVVAARRRVRRTSRRNPAPVRHRRRRNLVSRHRRRQGRRRNPPQLLGFDVSGLFVQALWTIGGGVATRSITQLALGIRNTGIMGYGANALTALILGWGTLKFAKNPKAAAAVAAGGFLGLTLRVIEDFTPYGKALALSGIGDHGMGMLLPSSYVNPTLYSGEGAEVLIPSAWRPPIAAPAQLRGLGQSTYLRSSYR